MDNALVPSFQNTISANELVGIVRSGPAAASGKMADLLGVALYFYRRYRDDYSACRCEAFCRFGNRACAIKATDERSWW